ncbi:MAG: hypothetical protein Q4E01_00215 [Actinomycetaceae bacterium]|nr:hypothetical protein [Actinomycetaceae bacterium]
MGKATRKKLQAEADAVADAALRHGEEWAARAQGFAQEGADWVAPRAAHLWEETVKATAPVIEEAQAKASEYARRGEDVARAAQKAAMKDGSLAERAQRAGEAARREFEKPKKSKAGAVAKGLGWVLLGTGAAGVGYLLWRRSQPIEDPWAEEYWADLDTDVDVVETPAEEMEEEEEE